MTREQIEARNAAIRAAWDDPLRRALMSAVKSKPGSKRSSRKAYNAYYRAYRKRKKIQAIIYNSEESRFLNEHPLMRALAKLQAENDPIKIGLALSIGAYLGCAFSSP